MWRHVQGWRLALTGMILVGLAVGTAGVDGGPARVHVARAGAINTPPPAWALPDVVVQDHQTVKLKGALYLRTTFYNPTPNYANGQIRIDLLSSTGRPITTVYLNGLAGRTSVQVDIPIACAFSGLLYIDPAKTLYEVNEKNNKVPVSTSRC